MGFDIFIIILGLIHLLWPEFSSPYLSERMSPKNFKLVTRIIGICAISIGVYWVVTG